ncbi:cationic amino acid transporter 1-like isoform X1 [Tripterygium wilfordii]|uniref:Cationic amino acid transporter 1-like isoform X1 n=1 Tax=Tripterygium wilfordii TaxID=458696 RepID=A0A7J7CW69_TRIWF|nr:cationic amino acid transporter 1-like [Tripterygium wilfordii]KAF5738347.1 cationic amino acid transporter 1-like isoform X1 [Tripterygium wilfordii]
MVTSNDGGGGGLKKRRMCGWSKQDFLPEESFKSWGNYVNALSSTKTRLKDRLLARSSDSLELQNVRARSQHEMKKALNWLDIMWFGIGAVMGAGIFVLTGEATNKDAGPAVIISYLISGISALLSVLCYVEFAIELPVAGVSFAYLRVELGDFVAYIAAGNILFEYVVAGASVARSWTSYFATLCNHDPNDFRINVSSFGEDYRHLDPIAVAVSIIICFIACLSIKGSSRFNSITTIIHLLVVVFIFIAGLTKANPKNITNFAPFGVRGIMTATAKLFFAYVGFDGIATLGEEIKNPGRDIPLGLVGSMLIIIASYCLLSATLVLMQPYSQIDVDAPFTLAFQAVGLNWAKYIVALGALKGMTTSLLANIIGQARYFTHIGRTHMAPPFLATINEKTGTPMNATIVMTVVNCVVAFFTSLDVLANLVSITTLFIFTLVAVALLVRRYYATGETSATNRNKFIGFMVLITGSSVGVSVYWARSGNGWVGYTVLAPIWFLATLGLQLTVKQARKAKQWGVPLLPWLPSASIAINIFIMGSFDHSSYVRFGIWTLLLLVYYLFVALHASYDAAKETQREVEATQIETQLPNNAAI